MKKYIHVTLRNKIVTYDELGNERTTNQKYLLKPCTDDNFKTEYGKQFFKRNQKDMLHCIDEETVFLQGTRDFQVLKKDHSIMIFEASKCTEKSLKELYGKDDTTECEKPEVINQWLIDYKKRMYIHVLNDKLDF